MYEIYTDGSCNNGTDKFGSWYFVVLKDDSLIFENGAAVEQTTSNRMEYTAAIESLTWLGNMFGQSNYSLRTDSQILVNSVMLWRHKWKLNDWKKSKNSREQIKNVDLVKDLSRWADYHQGNFVWVKGHNGNKWNEYCDQKCNDLMRGDYGASIEARSLE